MEGSSLVKHIDHVLVRAEAVPRLWEMFTRELELPVAWPPFEYQGFLSAAFSLGNTNVELLEPIREGVPEDARQPGGRPIGIAFEPQTIESCLAGLDERGIGHGEPWEYRAGEFLSWQSINIEQLPGCPIALFVKYSRDQDTHRARLLAQLAETGGGPMGATRLSSISFQADSGPGPWEKLLGPPADSMRRWQPGYGCAIELVTARPMVTIEVRSERQAIEALHKRALLAAGEAETAEIALEGRRTGIAVAGP